MVALRILGLSIATAAIFFPGSDFFVPSSAFAAETRYTKDRLSGAQIEALAAGPMEQVRSGDFEGGARELERLFARTRTEHGANSVEVADLLTAFGVLVYMEGKDREDDALRARSLPYLDRAIDAYRAAFGPDHPEVAVALNTYADAALKIHGGTLSAKAEQALEEAYRIRVATLGPTHAETLAALADLARLRGDPARTGKNPLKVQEAAVLFEKVIAGRPSGTEPELYENRTTARFSLAEMYMRNGLLSEALDVAAQATDAAAAEGVAAACVADLSALALADAFEEEGYGPEASQLRADRDQARGLECLFDFAGSDTGD